MTERTWQERAEAAEKTVEVLKVKVRKLYNGDASAIQRQLERARRRQEENRQRQALMAVRNQELKKHSERLEGEVRERTRAIRSILDNVTFGFLVIDAALTIQEGCTRSCTELFGTAEVAGRSLLDVLGVEGENKRAEFEMGVEQVFDDFIPAEVSVAQLPHRFEVGERVLTVEGRVIRAEEGDAVEAVLMTVSDITALEAAQREAQRNMVLMSLLRQRDAFHSFVADAKAQIETARETTAAGDQATARRAVHTVKGNAASFGLVDLAALIHVEEEQEVIDADALGRIEAALRRYLEENHAVLEMDYDNVGSSAVVLSPDALLQLRRIIDAMPANDTGQLQAWTQGIMRKPAHLVLGPMGQSVQRLASRLDKQVRFSLIGGDTAVDAELLRSVFQNLTHVVRNALDHGIEAAGARGPKDPVGQLTIAIHEEAHAYVVAVQDDGRGIDVDRVVEKAVSRGVIEADAAAALGARERSALIFADGVSTAECATDISGRGVGMSALKAEVERLGGEVTVTTEKGVGTSVIISVPKIAAPRAA